MPHPRIDDIRILRKIEALQLPMGRHGDVRPTAAIIVGLVEILRTALRILSKMKFPVPFND